MLEVVDEEVGRTHQGQKDVAEIQKLKK